MRPGARSKGSRAGWGVEDRDAGLVLAGGLREWVGWAFGVVIDAETSRARSIWVLMLETRSVDEGPRDVPARGVTASSQQRASWPCRCLHLNWARASVYSKLEGR